MEKLPHTDTNQLQTFFYTKYGQISILMGIFYGLFYVRKQFKTWWYSSFVHVTTFSGIWYYAVWPYESLRIFHFCWQSLYRSNIYVFLTNVYKVHVKWQGNIFCTFHPKGFFQALLNRISDMWHRRFNAKRLAKLILFHIRSNTTCTLNWAKPKCTGCLQKNGAGSNIY
jgi:hypothetical protein